MHHRERLARRPPGLRHAEIPLHRASFAGEYRVRVFAHFLREYPRAAPRTRTFYAYREIKFGVCLDYMHRLGAAKIATGHYARVACADAGPGAGAARLLKAADPAKDQSYFLHSVAPAALADTLFPLGELRKPDVRSRAHAAGLSVSDKPDSTGICFIGERPFQDFLSRYLKTSAGPIEDPAGRILGEHRGLALYTLGQRSGLGIGGRAGAAEAPWYVAAKDTDRNALIVVQDHDHPLLMSESFIVEDPHWLVAPDKTELECAVKTRYRQNDLPCTLRPEQSVGPLARHPFPPGACGHAGQYAVFYADDLCLGGGVIAERHPSVQPRGPPSASSLIILFFRWRDHDGQLQGKDDARRGQAEIEICSLAALKSQGVDRLPFSLKILLENLLRFEDGVNVKKSDIEAVLAWDPKAAPHYEIAFTPARVIMQDFTGVPCIVDLAAMREAIVKLGGDAQRVNPLAPAELVIDHSVQVDEYGTASSLEHNNQIEFNRNGERYMFLRWGQTAFSNFKVVPPNTGIVHQVNLERLARVVFSQESGTTPRAFPDTLVGTDSHTTMINGLGVLGWGVGGIEAEAAMLGQPVTMLIPQVIGFKLTGSLPAGTTATDLVLTVTEILRKKGVVDKFVEFFGDGLKACRSPTAPPSPTCRRSSARPAPSFRSTRKPCAISSSPAAPRSRSRSSRGTRRLRECGASTVRKPPTTPSGRARPRPGRARAGGPEASPGSSAAALRAKRVPQQLEKNGRGAGTEKSEGHRQGSRNARGEEHRDQGRRRAHRGDHELHQHLESRGPCRGGFACPQGPARSGSNPSHG